MQQIPVLSLGLRMVQRVWRCRSRLSSRACTASFKATTFRLRLIDNNNIRTLKHQRPPGGGRFLHDPNNVYEFNNWDNVVWDEQQEYEAKQAVEKNSKTPVSLEDREKYEEQADLFWDRFYMQHKNRFFKDRHWLFTEFPELAPHGVPDHIAERALLTGGEAPGGKIVNQVRPEAASAAPCLAENVEPVTESSTPSNYPGEHAGTRFLEVGCGVGNTVFPVLQTNNDPNLFVYCCDLSATAIQIVKDHPDYDPARCHGFVCDISQPDAKVPFPDHSLDLVVLIFVLSAINPAKVQETVRRLVALLKPGGRVVLRDYARYDLAQLRFKDGKCLQDNFYVRGDGTRVYFFTQEELRDLFTRCGLEEEQNLIDRRLQVNRGRQLKMYRVWVQCKYRKPCPR